MHSETSPYAAQTPTRIATAQSVGCEHGRRNLQGFAIQVITWQRLEIVMQPSSHDGFVSSNDDYVDLGSPSADGEQECIPSRNEQKYIIMHETHRTCCV